jgi:hypothetical protein
MDAIKSIMDGVMGSIRIRETLYSKLSDLRKLKMEKAKSLGQKKEEPSTAAANAEDSKNKSEVKNEADLKMPKKKAESEFEVSQSEVSRGTELFPDFNSVEEEKQDSSQKSEGEEDSPVDYRGAKFDFSA